MSGKSLFTGLVLMQYSVIVMSMHFQKCWVKAYGRKWVDRRFLFDYDINILFFYFAAFNHSGGEFLSR